MATPTKQDVRSERQLRAILALMQQAKRLFDAIQDSDFNNSKYNTSYHIKEKLGDDIYGALDTLGKMNIR